MYCIILLKKANNYIKRSNLAKAYLVDGARTRGSAKRAAGACWGRPAATKQDRVRRSAGGGGHPPHLGRHRSKERGSCRSGLESRRIVEWGKMQLRGRIRDLLFPSDPLCLATLVRPCLSIYSYIGQEQGQGQGQESDSDVQTAGGGFPQGSAQHDPE